MSNPNSFKIIYLVSGPLTERWLSYYRLDTLNQYFDIEFWDCSALQSTHYTVNKGQIRSYVHHVTSLKMIDERLHGKQGIIVPEIGFHKGNYRIFKRIAKYIQNCVIINVWDSPLSRVYNCPTNKNENEQDSLHKNSLKQYVYSFLIIKLFIKFLRFGPSKKYLRYFRSELDLLTAKRYTLWEQKCRRLFRMYEITYGKDALLSINHPDYEKYISLKQYSNPIISEDYIVFVGQYYPYHPDIVTIYPELMNQPHVAESYYKALNSFFDRLEQETKLKVVVAEHPSGFHKDNPFNGRQIVYYKTAELIKHAKAVCMHYSNSLNFVALFDKPVAIIECKALHHVPSFYNDTMKCARMINQAPVNIESKGIDIREIFRPIDVNLREKYVNSMMGRKAEKTNDELYVCCFQSLLSSFEVNE